MALLVECRDYLVVCGRKGGDPVRLQFLGILSRSIPSARKLLISSSASARSSSTVAPLTCPCGRNASSVSSGMVLTVSGQ
jgi:hypothetical protein